MGILLFEQFSNYCLANTVEPLRAANDVARRKLYDWHFLTLDGEAVNASSGLSVAPDASLREGAGGEILFLLPSYGFRTLAKPASLAALRSAAQRYGTLAGLDTGSWLLAAAGLLDGRPATIHWEELEGFSESFPEVEARRERFVIDGDRITCSGAMATYDLMSELLGRHHGEALRLEVSWLLMQGSASAGDAPIAAARSPAVQRAMRTMQEHVEEPLPMKKVARRVGLTQRALEQRFRSELGAAPRTVYRRIRLLAARKLVDETRLPVSEIALRCGYENPSAMTRAFAAEFGLTPRDIRNAV
ncbi:GlxA family transcriptional regulator [Hoeflea poritis]|uniref:GlxA family transcriptional regulator n=1 Tax=Hoeflea poritis TaxID=2993659 RepID=A0ABT4VHA8_9HYPH|nr:GlxA family transcriptional regulator [Hoeflea poritis]MDA4844092.1 GlxA family transcriptional regulator [Hoeflea poritis]